MQREQLQLIRPTKITDALLQSSSVIETAPAAWNSGTTYAVGDRASVLSGSVQQVYEGIHPGNLLLWSEDFSNAVWPKSASVSVTTNTDTAPDGTTTADQTVETTSGGLATGPTQTIAIANDGQTYTGSIYLKKTTTATNSVAVFIDLTGGTTKSVGIVINTNTGAFVAKNGALNCAVADAGTYWRVSFAVANNSTGNTSLLFYIYPAYGTVASLGTVDASATGSCTVWGAQVERSATLHTYLKTTSAALPNLNQPPATSPTFWKLVASVYQEYAAGTTYASGVFVQSSTTHRVYQSLQASNLGHALTDASWWLDVGPTNRWAMFDDSIGTLTTDTGTISVVLAPGSVDSLAVVDCDAELVTVTMKVGATVVYAQTQSTNIGGAAITDWFTYFFEEIGTRSVLTFLDLPVYPSATVQIDFTGADPAGPVSCGTLIVGRQLDIGVTEVGAKIGITDFSKKDTDDFGVTTVVERAWSKQMTTSCVLDTDLVDAIQRELAKIRAIPCLWIGEEGFDSLAVYGFFRDFSIDLTFSNISYCSLTIEGLT